MISLSAREEVDLAREGLQHVAGEQRDTLGGQVVEGELDVALADGGADLAQYRAAAEDLGLQALAAGAEGQHAVDQQFHGVAAVARRRRGRVAAEAALGEHEVVHPGDAVERVAQAHRDAGAEHGDDHQVFAAGEVLAGQQLHRIAGEVRIVVAVQRRAFPGLEIHRDQAGL